MRKKQRQPELIPCPATGEPCSYFSVCKARQQRIARGETLLPADFPEAYPDEAALLKEITDIADKQFCSELSINALWNIAQDEGRHPTHRANAESLAIVLIEVRASHAHWEQPL